MKRNRPLPSAAALLAPALGVVARAQGTASGVGPAAFGPVALLAGALVLLAAGVYLAWRRLGRDPKGVTIPRFEPPAGVSAALAAYLRDRAATSRVFTAAVAELAARGFVQVVGGPKPRIDRAPRRPEEPLPLELRALMEALLPQRRPQLELGRENGEILLLARSELQRNLARVAADYLRPNERATVAVALLTSLAIALAAGLAYGRYEAAILAGVGSLAYVHVGKLALRSAVLSWERHLLVPGQGRPDALARAAANLLPVLLGATLGGYGLGLAAGATAGLLAAFVLLAGAGVAYLLPAFTPEGARVWRHLQGLARYLGTTDERELRRLGAPEDAPETLRRLYPYAIALGVESRFASRLARYLDRFPEQASAALLWDTGPESYPRMPGRYTYSLGVSRSLHRAYQEAGAYTPRLPRGR